MDKCKIIFLLPDLGSGGAERVVSILSREFVKKNCDVDIVSLFGTRICYDIAEGVHLLNFSGYNTSLSSRISNLRQYLKQQKHNYEKVVAIAFQNSCLKSLVFASFGLGIETIATERNNPYKNGNSLKARIKSSIPYILSNKSVFQTDYQEAYYVGIGEKHKKVIPNPITKSRFKWQNVITPSKLVSICRLTPPKNLPVTLSVIERLKEKYPDVHLDIYGVGEMQEEIQNLIRTKGLDDNISLCGLTTNSQNTLSGYSVFLSTSDYEGISNSMLEAMSVGMSLVCTDCPVGGARMMLSEECGELCVVGNVDSIVSAIDKLLCNHDYARKVAHNAYKKTLLYTEERIAEEWYKFIF